MKALRIYLIAILFFLVVPLAMHAQSGCSDSPEAPTDVLMLVGSIGMMFGSSMVMKAMRKIKK
jgi:XrtJ-associated TM-motif-TM protein